MDQDLVSFVLRFVREAGEEQQARWRGVVKHVQSNTEASFSQFAEALAFMQGYVNDIVRASYEETSRMGQDFDKANEYAANAFAANPFAETNRLWGDYTKMMYSMGDAMGFGAGITKPMEDMMDATLSAWGMPTRAGQSDQSQKQEASEAVAAMTAQIAALNEKIAALENQLAELNKENGEPN